MPAVARPACADTGVSAWRGLPNSQESQSMTAPTGYADGRVPSLRDTRTAGCRPYRNTRTAECRPYGICGRQSAVPTGYADGRVPSLLDTWTAGCRPYGIRGRQSAVPTGYADGRVPSLRDTRTAECRPYGIRGRQGAVPTGYADGRVPSLQLESCVKPIIRNANYHLSLVAKRRLHVQKASVNRHQCN